MKDQTLREAIENLPKRSENIFETMIRNNRITKEEAIKRIYKNIEQTSLLLCEGSRNGEFRSVSNHAATIEHYNTMLKEIHGFL